MWFKNLQIHSLPPKWRMSPGTLEQRLGARPLTPCTGLNLETRGWVAPREDGPLVHSQEHHLLIALGTEQKLLPAAVVSQTVRERAVKLEAKQGYKPGRKQLRELKDEVSAELLPRAFARRRVTRAWLNPDAGWLAVDSASPSRAELLVETLRATFTGSFASTPFEAKKSAGAAMTEWLAAGDAPGRFALDQDCELKGSDANGATVRYVRHVLDGKDIPAHIRAGKQATRLGLTWQDRTAFVLSEPMQLKRLRLLNVEKDAEEEGGLSAEQRFEADFALMTGELSKLVADLVKALGGASEK